MKVAIYSRVSTEDQARHGYSLNAQREACRTRAAAALGAGGRVLEFADEGISGSLLDRPGLAALRQAVRGREVDAVVCYDPDRLSRSLAHQLLLTQEFEKAGVRLEFVNFEWENTPDGRLFYALRGAIAEYEREKIRERTTRGKLQKARQGGLPVGAEPYGYRLSDGRLVVDPAEAEVVRLIYHWFVTEDLGVNGVAVRLAERGIRTRSGKVHWQRGVVKTILTSPTYTGTFYYNRRDCQGAGYNKHLPPEKRNKPKPKPQEQWVAVPVPPIIDQADWQRVQAKIGAARRLWSGWSREEYLLSGLVTCPDCGNTMHGTVRAEGDRRERYYTCVKTQAGAANGGCRPVKRVRAGEVEQAVWTRVKRWLDDPEAVTREVKGPAREAELRADLERVRRHLAEIERGRDNIRNALGAGLLDLDAKTTGLLNDLKGRENQLQARRREIEAALLRDVAAAERVREIRREVKAFLARLDELDFERKKALVRALIGQVLVGGRGAELVVTVFAAFTPEAGAQPQQEVPGT